MVKSGRNDPCPCGSGKKYKHCCLLRETLPQNSNNSSATQLVRNYIEDATEHHQAGRFGQAEVMYRQILHNEPNNSDALHLLGLLALQVGQHGIAVELIGKAIRVNSSIPMYYQTMGTALASQGNLGDAVVSFRHALSLQPDLAIVHSNLGNALRQLGQFNEAVESCRRALAIQPDYAEAHNNLGIALQKLGQHSDAMASYRKALSLQPDLANAHNNLGNALREFGQLDEAVESCRRALVIQPDYAEAHNNLGVVLQELGQLSDSMASYQKALAIKPDFAEAEVNLGNLLRDLKQYKSAMEHYRKAIELKPDYFVAHNNLGTALRELGQIEEALASFRRALEINPSYADGFSNLLFALNYCASHYTAYNFEQACQFGLTFAQKAGTRFSAWDCADQPERLRVGLVSGDLCNHVVGYFLEEVLANIDPGCIELIAYPTHIREDELTARIRPYFSDWKSLVGKNDETAAHLIHKDGVHVLLDISGHTAYNRLPMFSWKPAPVQASWLGYFATTGLSEMDYLLADQAGVPEDQREQFTETIWYLPDTRLCFTAPSNAPPIALLPAVSNGVVTFGCFQNLSKISDDVLATWGEIFTALPSARLRLQCKQLEEPEQSEMMINR